LSLRVVGVAVDLAKLYFNQSGVLYPKTGRYQNFKKPDTYKMLTVFDLFFLDVVRSTLCYLPPTNAAKLLQTVADSFEASCAECAPDLFLTAIHPTARFSIGNFFMTDGNQCQL
jgi:hypothetical protein